MSKVEVIVPEPVDPTVVITMTFNEARGLNTLLRSGTTCELDAMLGIEGLQGELGAALRANLRRGTTLGQFHTKLSTNSIELNR